MAELVDYCYDVCGFRVQLTVTGGGPWDPVDAARKCANVIKGREHKFAKFEAANEAYNNGPDWPTVQKIGEILREAAPQNIVALSAPPDGSVGTAEGQMNDDCANSVNLHLDRSYGDEGWRHVRQPWDFKDASHPCSDNEPIGPASSVAAESDPLRLAMHRATSIMCAGEDYVFHNGAGIYGVPNTPGSGAYRTANIWEMPNIENIMLAVKNVAKILPPRIGNWNPANDGWAVNPNPLHCTEWTDTVGPIKNYASVGDGQFVVMPHGIRNRFVGQAVQNMQFTVYDPYTKIVAQDVTLHAGQTITLPAPPDNRQCAYIIVGRFI